VNELDWIGPDPSLPDGFVLQGHVLAEKGQEGLMQSQVCEEPGDGVPAFRVRPVVPDSVTVTVMSRISKVVFVTGVVVHPVRWILFHQVFH
jgi:hypothetical protein